MWNSVINFFAHSTISRRCCHWIDVYPETTTIVCSEVRRGVAGIVTRLGCHAPLWQWTCVSFCILVVCCMRLLWRTVSLSIGRRWIAMTLDPFRKRRTAQILLRSYHWDPLKLRYKWLNVKVIVNSPNLHSYAGNTILYYSFTTNKQWSSKYAHRRWTVTL